MDAIAQTLVSAKANVSNVFFIVVSISVLIRHNQKQCQSFCSALLYAFVVSLGVIRCMTENVVICRESVCLLAVKMLSSPRV